MLNSRRCLALATRGERVAADMVDKPLSAVSVLFIDEKVIDIDPTGGCRHDIMRIVFIAQSA